MITAMSPEAMITIVDSGVFQQGPEAIIHAVEQYHNVPEEVSIDFIQYTVMKHDDVFGPYESPNRIIRTIESYLIGNFNNQF